MSTARSIKPYRLYQNLPVYRVGEDGQPIVKNGMAVPERDADGKAKYTRKFISTYDSISKLTAGLVAKQKKEPTDLYLMVLPSSGREYTLQAVGVIKVLEEKKAKKKANDAEAKKIAAAAKKEKKTKETTMIGTAKVKVNAKAKPKSTETVSEKPAKKPKAKAADKPTKAKVAATPKAKAPKTSATAKVKALPKEGKNRTRTKEVILAEAAAKDEAAIKEATPMAEAVKAELKKTTAKAKKPDAPRSKKTTKTAVEPALPEVKLDCPPEIKALADLPTVDLSTGTEPETREQYDQQVKDATAPLTAEEARKERERAFAKAGAAYQKGNWALLRELLSPFRSQLSKKQADCLRQADSHFAAKEKAANKAAIEALQAKAA